MVKDHSDSERGNPLPPHGLLFPISTRVLLYAPSNRQDSTYDDLSYTSRGIWLEREISAISRMYFPPHNMVASIATKRKKKEKKKIKERKKDK